MDRIWIKDLRDAKKQGQEVIETYALRKIELKGKESDGKSFLSLELGDATGRIDAVMWNDAASAYKQVAQGDIVQLKGLVGSYKDSPQVKVDAIRKCQPGEYRPEHFLASSALGRAELEASIRAEVVAVKHPQLAKLLKLFFDDPSFMSDFLSAPAAKLWHHAWLGGLAEHTLAVCRLAQAAARNYPLLDGDLLVAGCLLHDIGKMREFSVTTYIDYSDDGRLMGHLVLGDQMLVERAARIKDFPAELLKRLRHIILAHHGEKEKGSPVLPATLEALVVYHCDFLDAHAAAFSRIIKKEGLENKRWSDYVNLIDRFIYLAGSDSDEPRDKDRNLKLF